MRLVHRRGVEGVTLAQVAATASVPLGNLYYYFRTKDALTAAVVAVRRDLLRAALERAEAEPTPAARVAALLEGFAAQAEEVARYGCPFGVLAGELERRGGALAEPGRELVRAQLEWLVAQYRAMGRRPAEARRRAAMLLCAKQGATQVAQALADPSLLRAHLLALASAVRAGREPRAGAVA